MKTGARIMLPPVFTIALMCILGGVGYWGIESIKKDLDLLSGHHMARLALANEGREQLLTANAAVYRLYAWIGNYDEERIAKEAVVIDAHINEATKRLEQLTANAGSEGEKSASAAISPLLAAYRKSIAQSIDLASVDVGTAAGMMQAADKGFLAIAGQLNQLVELQRKASDESLAKANQTAGQVIRFR